LKNELKRVLYWDLGIPRPPVRIVLHPTDKSNLKSIWSWDKENKGAESHGAIETKVLHKIVRDGCKMGVNEWIISGGGEPMLMRESLIDSMRFIKENLNYGELHTNGTMFTSDIINDMVEIAWDHIVVCLPSPEKENNDEIVATKGAFLRVVEGLEMFKDMKDELSVSLPVIDIYMPLMPQNLDEVGGMLKFAKRKGVSTLIVKPGLSMSDVTDEESIMTEEQVTKFTNDVPRIRSLSRSLRMGIEIGPLEPPEGPAPQLPWTPAESKKTEEAGKDDKVGQLDPKNVYCLEPFLTMMIRPSGVFGPCGVSSYAQERGKDYLSPEGLATQSLEDIWYGHFFSLLRDNAKTGFPANYCVGCTPELRKKQESLIKALRLKRDRFLDLAIKKIMQEAEKDDTDKEVRKRLREIKNLKSEYEKLEGKLQIMREFHVNLEDIRSSKLYRILRSLRVFRE
jgi:MoaA/NifB/PqqE/SkfB family radical SAM enzyme